MADDRRPLQLRELPACDRCHSRKVKCDRTDPCALCVQSQIACRRTREVSRRPTRKTASTKVKGLADRLTQVETALLGRSTIRASSQPPSGLQGTQLNLNGPSPASPAVTEQSEQNGSRQRIPAADSLPDQTRPESADDPATHVTAEARTLIEREFSSSLLLSDRQRSAFQSALSLVEHISARIDRVPLENTPNIDIEADGYKLTPAEVVSIAFRGQTVVADLPFPNHVPGRDLSRIAASYLAGNLDPDTKLQHEIILHCHACFLFHVGFEADDTVPGFSTQLEELKKQHFSAAIAALQKVTVLTKPSLTLLQALISGIFLYAVQGDISRSWSLMATAAQVTIALGYHQLKRVTGDRSTEAARHCLLWCFVYDKTLSMLWNRPPLLPKLRMLATGVIDFNLANSADQFRSLLVHLTQIQETVLEFTNERWIMDTDVATRRLAFISKSMDELELAIQKGLHESSGDCQADVALHWSSIHFAFHSVKTSYLHSHPNISLDPTIRQDCLRHARTAMAGLQSLQQCITASALEMRYDSYITWTTLSYPLCPFFVLFCDTLASRNTADFRLLQMVTNGLSSFSQRNAHVQRLHKLWSLFVNICADLVLKEGEDVEAMEYPIPTMQTYREQRDTGDLHPARQADSLDPNGHAYTSDATNPVPFSHRPGVLPSRDEAGFTGPTGVPTGQWDNELFWQLFQTQTSMEWCDVDFDTSIRI